MGFEAEEEEEVEEEEVVEGEVSDVETGVKGEEAGFEVEEEEADFGAHMSLETVADLTSGVFAELGLGFAVGLDLTMLFPTFEGLSHSPDGNVDTLSLPFIALARAFETVLLASPTSLANGLIVVFVAILKALEFGAERERQSGAGERARGFTLSGK